MCATMSVFYLGTRDQNSGPRACEADTLPSNHHWNHRTVTFEEEDT